MLFDKLEKLDDRKEIKIKIFHAVKKIITSILSIKLLKFDETATKKYTIYQIQGTSKDIKIRDLLLDKIIELSNSIRKLLKAFLLKLFFQIFYLVFFKLFFTSLRDNHSENKSLLKLCLLYFDLQIGSDLINS